MPSARAAAASRGTGITVDAIVDAAERMADSKGLDAVSLRAVAGELGVTPMALYRYVSTKDELIDLLVERLVERSVDEIRWPKDWAKVLRIVARSTRDLMLEHPVFLESCLRRAVTLPSANARLERILRVLVEAGLSLRDAVAVYSNILMLAIGYAATQSGRQQVLTASGHSAEEEQERVQNAVLEGGDFRLIREALPLLPQIMSEQFFESGLDRIIESVRTQLASSR